MTLQPATWPDGKQPECDCTRRTDGELACKPFTDGRCARCYDEVVWVDAEPERVECEGQTSLDL